MKITNMPKLTRKQKILLAPWIVDMRSRGMSLRDIRDTLSGFPSLSHEAIRNLIAKYKIKK